MSNRGKSKKVLGVLGGLGPMATAYFMEQIVNMTEADCDQKHIDMMVAHYPSIPDRTGFLIGKEKQNPWIPMIEAGKKLVTAGVCEIAVPCVTAHCYREELEMAIGCPVIDGVHETAKYLMEHGYGKVGILATDGVVQSGIFTDALAKYGIQCVYPGKEGQAQIMSLIYEDIKSRNVRRDDGGKFFVAADELWQQDVELVVLGCTELSLVKKADILQAGYLDVLDVLAKVCVEHFAHLKTGYKELIL